MGVIKQGQGGFGCPHSAEGASPQPHRLLPLPEAGLLEALDVVLQLRAMQDLAGRGVFWEAHQQPPCKKRHSTASFTLQHPPAAASHPLPRSWTRWKSNVMGRRSCGERGLRASRERLHTGRKNHPGGAPHGSHTWGSLLGTSAEHQCIPRDAGTKHTALGCRAGSQHQASLHPKGWRNKLCSPSLWELALSITAS